MEKMVILLVEDDEAIRYTLTLALKRKNYEVKEAESAEKAMKIIEKENFDCLLSDVELPEMDGIKLAEKVKKMKPDVKIVLMTAIPLKEKLRKIEEMKIKTFIKPFEVDRLILYLNGGEKI